MYTNILLEYHLHIQIMYINNALFKTDFIVLLKLALCHKRAKRDEFSITNRLEAFKGFSYLR